MPPRSPLSMAPSATSFSVARTTKCAPNSCHRRAPLQESSVPPPGRSAAMAASRPCCPHRAQELAVVPAVQEKMGGHGCLNLRPCSTSAPCRASAAASSCSYSAGHHARARAGRGAANVSCSAASAQAPPSQSTIKVVIVGSTKEVGRAATAAVSRARGMELAGAIDTQCIGQDAGELSGMEEPLEIPVLNDLTMVLGSIAQSRGTGVVVDFSEPSTVYDNVKQAAAFGLSSVVYVPKIEMDMVTELLAFCEKASMGCLVAPTLSIGSVLLQQATIQASFHYNNVEIVESRPNPSEIANNISDLGQIYNREDMDSDKSLARLVRDDLLERRNRTASQAYASSPSRERWRPSQYQYMHQTGSYSANRCHVQSRRPPPRTVSALVVCRPMARRSQLQWPVVYRAWYCTRAKIFTRDGTVGNV